MLSVSRYRPWRISTRFCAQVAPKSKFDIDQVTKDYEKRTQWAAANYHNKGAVMRMVLPPPNVTGKLHLGHALTVTVEDALCRHHRLQGGICEWLPGFDHAGIATQSVVERNMFVEQNLRRDKVSREDIVENCKEWAEKNSHVIAHQLKQMGASLSWNKSYYTLDEKFSKAVNRAFCKLYDQKLIFRDKRLVNWCPYLKSSVSDQEVEKVSVTAETTLSIPSPSGHRRTVAVGFLHRIRYPLENESGFVEVATSRPETVFADVGIAVHPEDRLYGKHIGKLVRHPLMPDKLLPVVADAAVIRQKGTGAVKITPLHDHLDAEIASRHVETFCKYDPLCMERICIDSEGSIINAPKPFAGLDRFDARMKVIDSLIEQGLYGGSLTNEGGVVALCSRTGDIIEPMMKEQWFMETKDINEEADAAIRHGRIRFVPGFQEQKVYDWLSNHEPWCLSRQLVWGHRIPAFHPIGEPTNWVAASTAEIAAQQLGTEVVQDPDVLDTWFSSALVPLVCAGWMDSDFDVSKLPLSIMETGWDILGFWVARMLMLTLRLTDGQIPFKEIMLHGLIRDASGRKMSKSLGNVIDPVDVLEGISRQEMVDRIAKSSLSDKEIQIAVKDINERYPDGIIRAGPDALRFALLRHDVLAMDIPVNVPDLVSEGYRFCNKLVNIVNYMESVFEKCDETKEVDSENVADRWILSRLGGTLQSLDGHMHSRSPHMAFANLHQFILSNLSDVYLEITKKSVWSNDQKRLAEIRSTLCRVMQPTLVQLSAFMPFISEHLYEKIFKREPGSIYSDFVKPSLLALHRDQELEANMSFALSICTAVRGMRRHLQIPSKMTFDGILVSRKNDIADLSSILRDYADLKIVEIRNGSENLPIGYLPCNLPGYDDQLALKIDNEYRSDFNKRLGRMLVKVMDRREMFEARMLKYKDITERNQNDSKVKSSTLEKTKRKMKLAEQSMNAAADEERRLRVLLAMQ